MVIVTAAIPWWNERPEDLDRCVRSLAGIADRLIALDGAYRRYPGATVTSDPAQAAAIREAAAAIGIECQVVKPRRLWAGQVEKRTHLLGLASQDSAWVLTVDADCIIHADAKQARRELAATSADVVTVRYWTPANNDRPIEESAVGIWHIEQRVTAQEIPHLWRALPGMRVERFHWWYSAIKDDRRVWLWVDHRDRTYPTVNHHRMLAPYKVEHRTLFRTPEQIRASRAFLNDREKVVVLTGQEDAVPGLPKPVWDYERMPA